MNAWIKLLLALCLLTAPASCTSNKPVGVPKGLYKVTFTGRFNTQGTFYFKPGTKLSQAIDVLGGFKLAETRPKGEIHIFRVIQNSKNRRDIMLRLIDGHLTGDLTLKNEDVVVFKQEPTWRIDKY